MSIFKTKQLWSNASVHGAASEGTQNADCLKIDKFDKLNAGDSILVAEGSMLSIYRPGGDSTISHLILETQMSDIILSIDTGKFTVGADDRQILVLHPQSYVIYKLESKQGHTDAGNQNVLSVIVKHSFTRRAHRSVCGPFGKKARDCICVQGLDGSLSFFDQDTFLFMCVFNDVIVPNPLSYISSCDCFVICNSAWTLEIFSYEQLRELSELNVRQNKKHTPQWSYNTGEEVTSLQVIQTSNNFSSILVLCERHQYCFQDNGLMKYVIRFDFTPICFCAYLVGWHYEPGARLLVMVVSDDSKLFVYEGTSMLWSCGLPSPTIAISRCFLKSLPGGLVTLSDKGEVVVSYLGTQPDLNANIPPATHEATDPEQIQAELEDTDAALKKILNDEDQDSNDDKISQMIQIKLDTGKQLKTPSDSARNNTRACPIIVVLTCEDPKSIKNVHITFNCSLPFVCTESVVCLDCVNGTEIVEVPVLLSQDGDIPDSRVKVLFTITDARGKIWVLNKTVYLPMSLYCYPTDIDRDKKLILEIQTNKKCIEFSEIFTDFPKEELLSIRGASDIITFQYHSSNETLTLKAANQTYSVEANDYSQMTPLIYNLLHKLKEYYLGAKDKDFSCKIVIDKNMTSQITHRFLKSIEIHAKERISLKKFSDELEVLQNQFTLIQKNLLVQYGSLPPGDCDALEFLMRDTHQRIVTTVHNIMEGKGNVCRTGNTLASMSYLIILLLKQITNDDFKIKLVEEMLSPNTIYEDNQEWEEGVTQALTYIMKNIFKSEKEKEKLAPVTEQGVLSHVNLKRFIKQLRLLMDNLISDLSETDKKVANFEPITRIEEFVEVI